MSGISLNLSNIIQGSLTLVVAITCSEAVREVSTVFKQETPMGNAIVKLIFALFMILSIFILAKWFPREPITHVNTVVPN